jgi:hypothetical protein
MHKNISLSNVTEKWLHDFLDYAIKNEYYTESDIKERFGLEFLEKINYRMPISIKSGKSD